MAAQPTEALARRILVAMRGDGQRTRPVALGTIDHGRHFLPPEYTQLYYSPLWPDLEARHRLRYAQLYALRTNEVIMLFERFLVRAVLPPMARRLAHKRQSALGELVLTMQREEEEHDAAFVALNRASRPDLYRDRDFAFFPPSAEVRGLVAAMGLSARWLAHPLWLLLFVEEASLTMARDMDAMGADRVEPHWLAVHQEHTRDERRHTLIDRLLFDTCYSQRGPLARRLDGWMFTRILRAMMFPRAHGAGARVVDQLIRDFPELAPLQPTMRREIVALGHNPAFLASLLSRRLLPRAWKLFHRCPELNRLGGWIPDYA